MTLLNSLNVWRPQNLPQGVDACFTLRHGGTSPMPWDSFNLGDHVGDDPNRVANHRNLLSAAVGHPLCFLNQVHGIEVARWHKNHGVVQQADAVWTDQAHQACVIMVADCLPVLWWSKTGQVIAAAHVGWRGLLGTHGVGILEATHQVLSRAYPQLQWQAWLGPCISPDAFEVGTEVRAAFLRDQMEWQHFFKPHPYRVGQWLADLPGMAKARLFRLGLTQIGGNDGTQAWCTYANPDLFFSHRRDGQTKGRTGRMAAVIWHRQVQGNS